MIEAGAPPHLDLAAVVTSELARSDAGATTQRARWEHGSLRMAARTAPRLFLKGLAGDFRSLAMALDIATPPLTILAAAIVVVTALACVAAFFGATFPLTLALLSLASSALAVGLGWAFYGRDVLPARALMGVVAYLAGKARVYGSEGARSAKRWTRTDRGSE